MLLLIFFLKKSQPGYIKQVLYLRLDTTRDVKICFKVTDKTPTTTNSAVLKLPLQTEFTQLSQNWDTTETSTTASMLAYCKQKLGI